MERATLPACPRPPVRGEMFTRESHYGRSNGFGAPRGVNGLLCDNPGRQTPGGGAAGLLFSAGDRQPACGIIAVRTRAASDQVRRPATVTAARPCVP